MSQINVYTNLRYGAHERSEIDLYVPAGKDRAPLVMMIHGGGWSGGHRMQYAMSGMELAKRGIAAASVGYPLMPDMVWPAMGYEVHKAAVWLKDNAGSCGCDMSRIITWGSSAGAQLALVLQALGRDWEASGAVKGQAPEITGTVAHCAAFDLVAFASDNRRTFMDSAAPEEVSPAHIAPAKFRSVFLVHSKPDKLFPYADVQAWVGRLKDAGVDADMHLSETGEHGFLYNIIADAAREGFDRSVDYVRRMFGLNHLPEEKY